MVSSERSSLDLWEYLYLISNLKNIFLIQHTVYCDRSKLDLSDETIGIENSLSAESDDDKTAKDHWICYVAEKRMVSKLSKISIPNFNSTKLRLE